MDSVLLILIAMVTSIAHYTIGASYEGVLVPILLLRGFKLIEAVPAVLLSQIIGNLLAASTYHRSTRLSKERSDNPGILRHVVLIGGVGAIFSAIGALTASKLSVTQAKVIVGVALFMLGTMLLLGVRWSVLATRRGSTVIGGLAGFFKGLGVGGFGVLVAGSRIIGGSSVKNSLTVMLASEIVVITPAVISYVLVSGMSLKLMLPLMTGVLLGAFLAPRLLDSLARFKEFIVSKAMGLYAILVGGILIISASG